MRNPNVGEIGQAYETPTAPGYRLWIGRGGPELPEKVTVWLSMPDGELRTIALCRSDSTGNMLAAFLDDMTNSINAAIQHVSAKHLPPESPR